MGMELRIREPSADGVAPSRRVVALSVGLPSPEFDCWVGVSRTSFRNCELFIVTLGGGNRSLDVGRGCL